jgi:hypothetical protein
VFEGFFGAIDELIGEDDFARFEFGLQGADGADADDPADAELFHAVDVGAGVQFAGKNTMAAGVAREENDVSASEFAGEEFIGGIAEGGLDFDPFLIRKPFNTIEAAAADNADA